MVEDAPCIYAPGQVRFPPVAVRPSTHPPLPFLLYALHRFFLLFLATAFPAHATELIRADRSETILRDSGVLRIEAGNVSYRQTERLLSVTADSARLWIPDEGLSEARFFGRVVYRDSAIQLDAANLTYLPRTAVATFSGKVRVTESDRLLTARRVAYHKNEHRMDAEGGVTLNYGRQGIILRAPEMTYHVLADSGSGTGGIQAVRVPEPSGDSLTVRSESMVFANQSDRIDFLGRVGMEHAGMVAGAPRGRYFRVLDRLELDRGASAVWIQRDEARADSVTFNAERMQVHGVAGNILDEIVLVGDSRLRMESAQPEHGGSQTVNGDSVVLDMAGGRIVGIEASGEASTMVIARNGATVDLAGQQISMDFLNGDLDSLTVQGVGNGIFVSSDSATVSRISGGMIAFGFDRGAVRKVAVIESARCTHRSETDKTGDIQLSGDRVNLVFEGDRLTDVRAEGGVRGRYRPVEAGEAP